MSETAFIPLSVPVLHGRELDYVRECIETNWVSSAGSYVDRFEAMVAEYTGAEHAVAVVNGTAALHVTLHALGIGPGDEVVVPSLTFVAPVNAILYCGASPVFMDASESDWQLDPAKLERFLEEECEPREGMLHNRRTGAPVKAVLPVHLMGLGARVDRVLEIAERHGLLVVEDAAEALGVRYRGRHVGTWARAGCLSFNGNKIITTGGGGMVLTDDADLAACIRYLTTQAKDDPVEYIHNDVGFNYRLTNIQAALGVAQMEQLEGFIGRKREIAGRYEEALAGIPGIRTMPTPPEVDPTYWLYTILVDEEELGIGRRELLGRLAERRIQSRPFWHTIHTLPPYRPFQAYDIEVADRLYRDGLSIPCSSDLTVEAQDRVIRELTALVKQPMA